MRLPPELEQAVLARNGKRRGEEIQFRCPCPEVHANGDAHPSARYHRTKHTWHCDVCEEGGGWTDLCSRLGISVTVPGRRPEPAAIYEYRNEAGALLRRKVRWKPGLDGRRKIFSWEKPNERGGWAKCQGDGNPKILYYSEQLPGARVAGTRVLVVEGEKDANSALALGLVAVTNPEGAGSGKWRLAYSEQLRGLDVTIIADKDAVGRAHAQSAAASLSGVAASVRVLELPGDGVKDLSDWVDVAKRPDQGQQDIRARLDELLREAPVWGANPAPDAAEQPQDPQDLQPLFSALGDLPERADLERVEQILRELAERSAHSDSLSLEVVRERAQRLLAGKVKAPARLVEAALQSASLPTEEGAATPGRVLALEGPEPWPEPVGGAGLLAELESTLKRFVSLPEGASTALALWVLHTYSHEAATVSPILALVSPEKRSGKTTTLSLLGALVRRSLPASNITPSALFRSVEKFEPTLLIDEADTFLQEREELRGILNSGHTRGAAFVVRTVGEEHEPRLFSTWAPKAIALIGRLPSTLEDRSVVIPLRRKTAAERVERLRLDRLDTLAPLRRKLLRWSRDHVEALRKADPEVPAGLHDRAADNWRALLALADACGGSWPQAARRAAVALSGGEAVQDSSTSVRLLADLREIFRIHYANRYLTDDLLRHLCGDESKPWGEWSRGGPLTAIGLARLLQGFEIRPRKIRIGDKTRQGYLRESFDDAFARYIPFEPEHPEQVNRRKDLRPSTARNISDPVPTREADVTPSFSRVVPGVPGQDGASGVVDLVPATDREVLRL